MRQILHHILSCPIGLRDGPIPSNPTPNPKPFRGTGMIHELDFFNSVVPLACKRGRSPQKGASKIQHRSTSQFAGSGGASGRRSEPMPQTAEMGSAPQTCPPERSTKLTQNDLQALRNILLYGLYCVKGRGSKARRPGCNKVKM